MPGPASKLVNGAAQLTLLTLLVGCGGLVVFVDDDGGGRSNDGGRASGSTGGASADGGGSSADGGGSSADLNGWYPSCPGHFSGDVCPAECPVEILPVMEGTPGKTYCTTPCVSDAASGCPIGAVCQHGFCFFGPCDLDQAECPGTTVCVEQICAPVSWESEVCVPHVVPATGACQVACSVRVELPDATALCTTGCSELSPCALGFSCRPDLAPIDGQSICLPDCAGEEDCPSALACDDLGHCSAQ